MARIREAYADGRQWDDGQPARVNDVLNKLREALDVDDLNTLRKHALWLQDVLFPTGFAYFVNCAPTESVTGGLMDGLNDEQIKVMFETLRRII